MASPVPLMGILLGYRKGISGMKSVWLCHFAAQFKALNRVAHVVTCSPVKAKSRNPYCSCARRHAHMVTSSWTVFWALINGIACSRIYPAQTEYKWPLPVFAWSSQGQTYWPSSVLQVEMVACFLQFCLKILPKCVEAITLFCQSSPASLSHRTVPCQLSESLLVFLDR